MDLVQDWRRPYAQLVYQSADFDAEKKTYIPTARKFAGYFETYLKDSTDAGASYVIADRFTIADVALWEILDINLRIDQDLFKEYPTLAAYHKRVAERPNLAAYLASGRRPAQINGNGKGN